MTDRTTKLRNDYEAMQGLIERFQHRLTLRVEPEKRHRWYLFEREGRESWIAQYEPEMYEYMKRIWETKGWTITPIDIFRTGS